METASPQLYEKIRLGASYRQLCQSLKLLSQKITNHPGFLTILNTVLLSKNIIDTRLIRQLIDFAHRQNITHINFFVSDNVVSSKVLAYFQKNRPQISKIYQQLSSYARSKSVNITLPSLSSPQGQCTSPWLFPYISVSGDVFPCCAILHLALADGQKRNEIIKKYSLGNIFNSDINQIWNSPKAIGFRKSFINRKYNPYCLLCSKFYGFK
jgi:MoaA/NifB/PqqE/SkfB family radical SAM enzyme